MTTLSQQAAGRAVTALLGTKLWLTADGSEIWKVGVEPDVEVTQPIDEGTTDGELLGRVAAGPAVDPV